MKFTKKVIAAMTAIAMLSSMAVATSAFAAEDESALKTGDVNGDGKVAMEDVTDTQKYIAKLVEFDEAKLKAADVDAPYDEVTMVDVTTIQKHIAKLIDVFPADEREDDSDTSTDTTTDTSTDTSNDTSTDTTTDTSTDTSVDTSTDSATDTDNGVLTPGQARATAEGVVITVRGQVSYIYGGTTVILEDIENGKVTGYQIYDKSGVEAGNYPMNAIVEVTGKTSVYNTVPQISKPTEVKCVSEGNNEIPPVEVTVDKLQDYISTKVVIRNAKITPIESDSSSVTVTDDTGSVNLFRPADLPEDYEDGMSLDIVCCPYVFDEKVQIRNSSTEDYTLRGGENTEDDSESLESALADLDSVIKFIVKCGDDNNDEGLYKADQYDEFKTLFDKAVEASEKNGEGYTVEELKKLAEDLFTAWYDLDYTAYALISDICDNIKSSHDDVNNGMYTEESYAVFEELYNKALAYLEDTSTLTEEEAEKLYDDLAEAWYNLKYTPHGGIVALVNEIKTEKLDTNGDLFTTESYAVFYGLYEQALAYVEAEDKSEWTDETLIKLYSDILNAYNSLKYTRAALLLELDDYIEMYAEYYEAYKDDAQYSQFIQAYEKLLEINADADSFTDDEIDAANYAFYKIINGQ